MNPTVCFSGTDCDVIKKHYTVNDQIAIQLVTSDTERNRCSGKCPGEPVCTATECFTARVFSDSETAIKDFYSNRGVLDALKSAGLVEETTCYINEGCLYYPVVKVNF